MKFKIENKNLHSACSKIIKAMSLAQRNNVSVLIKAEHDCRTLKLTGINFAAAANMPFTSITMNIKNVDVFESGSTVMTFSEFVEFADMLKPTTDCNADNAG